MSVSFYRIGPECEWNTQPSQTIPVRMIFTRVGSIPTLEAPNSSKSEMASRWQD